MFEQGSLLTVVPLYKQMSRILENEITKGKIKQGEKLPSEAELCTKYNVSRITVRAAMEDLVEAGLIVKIQGKGAFVTKNMGKRMLSIGSLSFQEMCEKDGAEAHRIEIEKKLIPASDSDIEKLGLKEGNQVIHIERVLQADRVPVILATDHIVPEYKFLLNEDLENNSMNRIMMQKGNIKEIKSKERTIELCMATQREAELLNVTAGTPMLMLRDLITDSNGKPIRWVKEIMVGDRIRIEYKSQE